MRKFSPNITDQELNDLFREAAENFQPFYTQAEKQEQWELLKLRTSALQPVEKRRSLFVCWRHGALLLVLIASFIVIREASRRTGLFHKNHDEMTPAVTRKTLYGEQGTGWLKKGRQEKDRSYAAPDPATGLAAYAPEKFEADRAKTVPIETIPIEIKAAGIKITGIHFNETRSAEKTSGQPANPRRSKWRIGVTAGTDWGMVKGNAGSRTGIASGFTLQYQFAKRWSIESGLLIASKIYSARPQDYHSSAYYPGLISIDARCRVFDLPLNVRYDVLQHKSHEAFVSAGFSSFWMQKESYVYKSKINGNIQSSERTIYGQNRHILSIANISAGYEHTWDRTSLQVNPYIKIPLAGVGNGKVDLVSMGMLISVKYRL